MVKPLLILGSIHVLLGGIIPFASATAFNCSILTGNKPNATTASSLSTFWHYPKELCPVASYREGHLSIKIIRTRSKISIL